MSADFPALPEPLRRGVAGASLVAGVLIAEDWSWHAPSCRWALPVTIGIRGSGSALMPALTRWYALIDDAYPAGDICFVPAKEGGIAATFSHQRANRAGAPDLPWRQGTICLEPGVRVLEPADINPEPRAADERLAWRLERAVRWTRAAARGELAPVGEPFEIPDFPVAAEPMLTVVVGESADSLRAWQPAVCTAGLVEFARLRGAAGTLVARRFFARPRETIHAPTWGDLVREGAAESGIWILLPGPPVLPPWEVPETWKDLDRACRLLGIDWWPLVRGALPSLRDGRSHVALIGYPIPARVADPPVQIQWQAVRLPALSYGGKTQPGFRPNEMGHWRRDRAAVLRDSDPIPWLRAENWHPSALASRGRFPADVSACRTLIIGVGALGAAVAELLVRAGMGDLTLLDSDSLQAGNLARHTLGLADRGRNKAEAVAERLQQASPHARIRAIARAFPAVSGEMRASVADCDVVLDCTGDDAVIDALASYPWHGERIFASLSLGLFADRLFCFVARGASFPATTFRTLTAPWLRAGRQRHAGRELPPEGIGCYHPVMPARADDVWLLAAVAVKHLAGALVVGAAADGLRVYELVMDGAMPEGVRLAHLGGEDV